MFNEYRSGMLSYSYSLFKPKFASIVKQVELHSNIVLILFFAISLFSTYLVVHQYISGERNIAQQNAAEIVTNNLYVSPSGLDNNAGTSASAPLKTIQAALNKATAGTQINIGPGIYREKLTTMRAGTANAPIILKGPESGKVKSDRYKAVVHNTGRIINVNHSYYIFDGFTIDGNEKVKNLTYPTTLSAVKSFKDNNQRNIVDSKLLYIGSADSTRNLTGITVRNMFLHGAGTECVRIRNNATNNIVEDSVIEWCGMYGGGNSDQYEYHNGEGVYIGTSPKSTTQPMYANDGSSFNTVRNNTIYTFGSECFEVKENAHDNTFQGNDCRYNDEPYSELGSNIELRGYNNKILNNTIRGSRSIGLKMKSDSASYTQGGNIAQNNAFSEIANESIRNDQNKPQGLFCGNTFTGTILVGSSVGNPTTQCPTPTGTPAPTMTQTPPTTTPVPTVVGISATPTTISTPTSLPTTAPTSVTFSVRVSTSSDDAEQNLSNNSVNLTSTDLELTTDSANQQIGMRFQRVTVPKGAKITNAYVEFTADGANSGTTNLVFYGEAAANASTFTTSTRNISNRVKTSANVAWNAVPSWSSGNKYQTPNLAPVVQAIVNQPNWASSNALSIIVTGSGKRLAKSYNDGSSTAPRLVIVYTQ